MSKKRKNSNSSKSGTPQNFVSLVIPCYNETQRIGFLKEALQHFTNQWMHRYEIIIIDDGSTDGTAEAIVEDDFFKTLMVDNKLLLHQLPKNAGKGAALKAGVELASGDHILTLDTDMSTNPLEIQKWLKSSKGKFADDEVLIADRTHPDSELEESAFRQWVGYVFNFFVRMLTALRLKDTQCGYKLYPAKVAKKAFGEMSVKGWAHDVEVLYRAVLEGIKIRPMPVKWTAKEGSKINVAKDAFGMFFQVLWIAFIVRWDWYIQKPFRALVQEGFQFWKLPSEVICRFAFMILAFALLIFMPYISKDFGISGDEKIQNDYGKQVYAYFFEGDETALDSESGIHYYSGGFDFVAVLAAKTFDQYDEYRVRHFVNALFGFLAILFTGLLAAKIGGWRAGLLALLFLAISPRFFGHSMNNPKDIPFAAAMIFSIFYFFQLIKYLPKVDLKAAFWSTFGIAFALNIRIGGLLLIAFLGFFVLSALLYKVKTKSISFQTLQPQLPKMFLKGLVMVVVAYFAGLAFWPYGLQAPLKHPIETLQTMQDFFTRVTILFQGEMMNSADVKWDYIPTWMLITNPLVVLLGIALSLLLLPFFYKKYGVLNLFLLLFVAIFPLAYAIYKGSNLYDGWRHFLFIYPPLVIFAALSWDYLMGSKAAWLRWVAPLTVVGLSFLPIKWMAANHPHAYVYFNEAFGGLPNAFARYETDYYMNSMKPAVDWFLANEYPKIKEEELIKINTNCGEPLVHYFKDYENIKVRYGTYRNRTKADWSYGFYLSRYEPPAKMENNLWPPRNGVLKNKEAQGVPLATIIKRPSRADFLGHQALEQGDDRQALAYFEEYLEVDPENELVLIAAADAALRLQKENQALTYAAKAAELMPEYDEALRIAGMVALQKNQLDEAMGYFQRILQVNPSSIEAYVYIGEIFYRKGDLRQAQQFFGNVARYSQHAQQRLQEIQRGQ